MRKKRMWMFAVPLLAFFLMSTVISCNSKPKDAEIKTAVDNAIAANTSLAGAYSDVKEGVVTLSGEVKDNAAKESAESTAKGVKGVKSVNNNLSIAPAPAPVVITPDDPLKTSVDAAIKTYPGVTATINDGVVTLNGEIKKIDLQKLMMALNALKPKKIDNKLTIK